MSIRCKFRQRWRWWWRFYWEDTSSDSWFGVYISCIFCFQNILFYPISYFYWILQVMYRVIIISDWLDHASHNMIYFLVFFTSILPYHDAIRNRKRKRVLVSYDRVRTRIKRGGTTLQWAVKWARRRWGKLLLLLLL